MDGTGNEFFSGTGLAKDQDGRISGCDGLDVA
jgi:hypothetical protein